jgi:beta-glucanase (GH16 family)
MSENNGGGAGYVEIDAPEVEGNHADRAEYDIWYNSDSGGNTEPQGGKFISQGAGNDSYLSVPDVAQVFHFYGLKWSAGRLDYYLDGVLVGSCTQNVPTPGVGGDTPGIDLNHYGCNSSGWGGAATVGVKRFMYVKSVNFWTA